MPHIEAFRGLRYDLGHVGPLSDVVAPPYDVIGRGLQDELYEKHPANVIRLILNREEPGDDESSNRYSRASRFLKNWQREGVLQTDPDPAVYVYHQVFSYADTAYTRRGFMCRLQLERFGEGKVYPHEETHSAAKADRLKLTKACRANLSQIFGIYPDTDNQVQNLLENAIADTTPLEATDHLGVVHRLWSVTDVKVLSEVSAVMDEKPMYVADGHHRYETACNYRDELSAQRDLPAKHSANFVLTMCVGMHDPGMIVLPTHRLLNGAPDLPVDELTAKLSPAFDVEPAGSGPEAAGPLWSEIEMENQQGTIGFYSQKSEKWVIARLSRNGRQQMSQIANKQSTDWQGLGVSLLHRLALETLLDAGDLPKPTYVHLVDEVVEGLQSGNYPLAALVMPATLDHIRAISEHGERMPAKSTYFYPKLLCGLVLNPLE
jgi:uncharacterized protein (DUF1015 family)